MSADPRGELRQKLTERLAGCLDSVDAAADAVMALFPIVTSRTDEHETTTFADRCEQHIWSRYIVAEFVAEYGSYTPASERQGRCAGSLLLSCWGGGVPDQPRGPGPLPSRRKEIMSVLYEKGSAAWDIGIILTRHTTGDGVKGRNGSIEACHRAAILRQTATLSDASGRLALALGTECTCGAGDSPAERTSIGHGTVTGLEEHDESAGSGPGPSVPAQDPPAA